MASDCFWRLFLSTVVMLAFGYAGETGLLEAWIGFFFGMAGWGYILFEIFKGEAGGVAGDCSATMRGSFNYMRVIVTAGWSIYPLGYYYGYLLGSVDEGLLNVVYNLADFVNTPSHRPANLDSLSANMRAVGTLFPEELKLFTSDFAKPSTVCCYHPMSVQTAMSVLPPRFSFFSPLLGKSDEKVSRLGREFWRWAWTCL